MYMYWHDEDLWEKLPDKNDHSINPFDNKDLLGNLMPGLRFENVVNDVAIRMHWVCKDDKYGSRGFCSYQLWATATFLDPVDARLFPYDMQANSVDIRLEEKGPFEKRYFITNSNREGYVSLDNKHVPEWDIMGIQSSGEGADGDKEDIYWTNGNQSWVADILELSNGRGGWKAKCTFSFFSVRRAKYYEMNVFALSFVTALLGELSFLMDRTDMSSRLAFNVTLMLAAIAERFAFGTSLPKLPYSTVLDVKVYGNFMCLTFLMMEQGLVLLIDPNSEFVPDWAYALMYLLVILVFELFCYLAYVRPAVLGLRPFTRTESKKAMLQTRVPDTAKLDKMIAVAKQDLFMV